MSDGTLDKLAYSIPNLAAAMDLSVDSITKAIKRGDLTALRYGTKPLISKDEAIRWRDSLTDDTNERA